MAPSALMGPPQMDPKADLSMEAAQDRKVDHSMTGLEDLVVASMEGVVRLEGLSMVAALDHKEDLSMKGLEDLAGASMEGVDHLEDHSMVAAQDHKVDHSMETEDLAEVSTGGKQIQPVN